MKATEKKQEKTEKSLPDGWKWVRLGDVCDFIGGMQPPKSTFSKQPLPGYVRLVQIQDFRRAGVEVYIPENTARRKFDETDVMIGRYGPPVFQILRGLSGAYNVALMKTVPRPELTKEYLFYLLQEPSIQNAVIDQSQRSAGQSGVQREFLEKLVVPFPPLDEQHRIVAILNDRLSAVEKARVAAIAQLEAAKALPAAYLRQVFDSSEAQKWNRKKLGDVCELLPAKSIATEGDTEVFAITTACLSETGFQPAGVKRARMTCTDAAISKVAPGEVLIARSNTADLVGRVAMYSGEVEGVVASDLTIRIKPHSILTSTFLNNYLSSLYIQGYWKEKAGGASDSMKKITRSQLLDEFIPIPDLPEQHKITNAVSEKLSGVTALKRSLQDQLDAINQLPAALLRQAFNGKL